MPRTSESTTNFHHEGLRKERVRNRPLRGLLRNVTLLPDRVNVDRFVGTLLPLSEGESRLSIKKAERLRLNEIEVCFEKIPN